MIDSSGAKVNPSAPLPGSTCINSANVVTRRGAISVWQLHSWVQTFSISRNVNPSWMSVCSLNAAEALKSQRLLKRVGEEKPRGQWADLSASAPISHKRVRRLPSWTEAQLFLLVSLYLL